jgi:alpha-D-ribose 1-methylphosphonate 5-triphosphate synthase subunit PhnG
MGGDESLVDVSDASSQRKLAMGIFSRAETAELSEPIARHWPDLSVRDLRPVEVGLIMLRGRVGGDGKPFNLGEATIARAVVELEDGRRGFGHVLGRDREHARLAAIADALWQGEAERDLIEREVVMPVSARLTHRKARQRAETAATKVDFFTLVRGED